MARQVDVGAALVAAPLFADLSEDQRSRLEPRFRTVGARLGEVVVSDEEGPKGLFVIVSGRMRVVGRGGADGSESVTIATLGAGDTFGGTSLLTGENSRVSVRAAGTVVLLHLPLDLARAAVEEFPVLHDRLKTEMERQAQVNFLRRLGLFSCLDLKTFTNLLNSIEPVSLTDGAVLFEEGDEGDAIYVVRDGSLEVVKRSANDLRLAVIGPGAMLGESAIITGEPRSASVIAHGPATVMRLSAAQVQKIIAENQSAADYLAEQSRNFLLRNQARLLEMSAARKAAASQDHPVTLDREPLRGRLFSRLVPVARSEPDLSIIACLVMVLDHHGKAVDVSGELRRDTYGVELRPCLHALASRIEASGLLTRLMALDAARLDHVVLPAVTEFHDGAFVVVYRITPSEVVFADPREGLVRLPRAEFESRWAGQMLTAAALPDFAAAGTPGLGLVRQFWPMVKPLSPMLGQIGAITLLGLLLGLLPPFFTQLLIDRILVVGDWSLLYLMLAALMSASIMGMLTGALREFLFLYVMRRLAGNLLARFFAHILSLRVADLRRWNLGELLTRFDQNDKILEIATSGTMRVVTDSLAIFIYLPVMFWMNPMLALVGMGFVLTMAVFTIVCSPVLRRQEQLLFDCSAAEEAVTVETVTGIGTIKSLGREEELAAKGLEHMAATMRAQVRSERFNNMMSFVLGLLQQGATVMVLIIGALMVLDGKMTPGALVAFSGILGAVVGPSMGLANTWNDIVELRVSLARVVDVLAVPREVTAQGKPCPPLKGHVTFRGVTFRHPGAERPTLDAISLDIPAGSKVALVGRSGSGKTTLVSLVNRLLEPTEGQVLIDGVDIGTCELLSLRRQIGVVEQSPHMFSGTIRENIAKGNPTMSRQEVVAAAAMAGARDFIEAMPLTYDTRIGEGGRSVSGGQAQRLAIARAIALQPALLILDEATAALDNESERLIQKNLKAFMQGRTSFIIAHRLSTIREADLILVMDNGRIVEQGTHDTLMAERGLYFYLVTGTA